MQPGTLATALALLFASLAPYRVDGAEGTPPPPASEEGPVKRYPEKAPAVRGQAAKVRLELTGMVCGGCAETIARLLTTIDGVISAEVDLKSRRGEVQFDDARVTPERLLAKIKANGYGAKVVADR
ncbi:MAG: heavy-metal-associated domain-containing protein [Verrucomicrobia bacterium]|nr:heavy-metal-associated domain-containing protein [Verrucomicrobiota bacterium]